MKKLRLFSLLAAAALLISCTQLLYSSHSPIGQQISGISDDLIPAEDRATGLYGYLNNLGLWVIAPQFKGASSFSNGIARVYDGRYYGAINPLGQWVIQPVFKSTVDCSEAITSIKKGRMAGIELWYAEDPATELYGFLNHFGAWHITPQYENVSHFNDDGHAFAKPVGGNWGVINRQNQWVIQPNFNSKMDAERALKQLMR